jgi:hypothetical protein
LFQELESTEDNICKRFAVNNCNTEEVVVYMGLAWSLVREWPIRFGMTDPGYYEHRKDMLARDGTRVVRWAFELNPQMEVGEVPNFVPARTFVPIPPTPESRAMKDKSVLLPVPTLDTVTELLLTGNTVLDATIFAGPSSLAEHLPSILNGESVPSLPTILRDGGLLAHIRIDEDYVDPDSVLLVSNSDIRARVNEMAKRYDSAIARYEEAIPSLATYSAACSAIARLRDGADA